MAQRHTYGMRRKERDDAGWAWGRFHFDFGASSLLLLLDGGKLLDYIVDGKIFTLLAIGVLVRCIPSCTRTLSRHEVSGRIEVDYRHCEGVSFMCSIYTRRIGAIYIYKRG